MAALASSWTLDDQADPEAITLWDACFNGQPADQEKLSALYGILTQDFPTFCALLLKVRPKGGGYVVPLLFNQVQRRIWAEICLLVAAEKPLWFVMLKFRQAGMSTFWCAWIFWQIWRQGDIQAMVIAHQKPTAEMMIETMRVFYGELPPIFKPDLRDGNHGSTIPRGEVYFANLRSWCNIHLASNLDPRGAQTTHVLETEFASYPDAAELNGALMPQLPTFGSEARLRSSFVIESTPKGQNAFHDIYWQCKNGERDDFHAMFWPWFIFDDQYGADPPPHFRLNKDEIKEQTKLTEARRNEWDGKEVTTRQMYWRRQTIISECDGSVDRFDQEYPSSDLTCFLLASKSVFRQYTRYLDLCVSEASEIATKAWAELTADGEPITTKGPVRLRFTPKIEERGQWTYMSMSLGDFAIHPHGRWQVWEPPMPGHKYVIGGDPAMGIEGRDNSVACVIDVTAARQVAEFCDNMSPEKFAVEMAAAGYWYNNAMLIPEINRNSTGYVVLKRLSANILYPNMFKFPKFNYANQFTQKRGWETTSANKQLLVSSMINHIENETIAIASKDLLSEMSTYEQKEGVEGYSFNAQKGRRDDRVMAFGLAIQGLDQTPVLVTELTRSRRRIPSARELHLASNGMDERPAPVIPQQIQDQMHITHEMSWNPMSDGVFS